MRMFRRLSDNKLIVTDAKVFKTVHWSEPKIEDIGKTFDDIHLTSDELLKGEWFGWFREGVLDTETLRKVLSCDYEEIDPRFQFSSVKGIKGYLRNTELPKL